MAKAFFINNAIRRSSLSAMCLNDTQYQETKPLAYQAQFVSVEISDTDYNDFYKGKKEVAVNEEDGTISAVDLPTIPQLQTEKQFEIALIIYKNKLKDFKKFYPTHSKMSEIQNVSDFVNSIDITQLTFPHKNFKRHLVDNDRFIELAYI